jgi:nucleoside-diphosphate-sugar epimerase
MRLGRHNDRAAPSTPLEWLWDGDRVRVLVLGGTGFIGRRIVERLHERGDDVLVVHRGMHTPDPWVSVNHLLTDRRNLRDHTDSVREFDPTAIVDSYALTGRDVECVLGVLPEVKSVVLSSQDVYQAYAGIRSGRCTSPVPLTEESQLRTDRYPYRGSGYEGVPEDYEKLDVEQLWLDRGAVVLRLPMVYGPHDDQVREDAVLRRIRAGRRQIPVGVGNLLWSRGHVDDIATGALAALDFRDADGIVVNLAERETVPIRTWYEQIMAAAGGDLELIQVPDDAVPADLSRSKAFAQHMLVSVYLAEELLEWNPGDAERRVAESVGWHLEHPPSSRWTSEDNEADERALQSA